MLEKMYRVVVLLRGKMCWKQWQNNIYVRRNIVKYFFIVMVKSNQINLCAQRERGHVGVLSVLQN